MIPRTIKLIIVILTFSMAAALRAESDSTSVPEVRDGKTTLTEHERLSGELKLLKNGLPAKKEELARLRRKWTLAKGRMPSAEEIKEFEEKRAEGEVKVEDNPYVNKSPLSSVGRHREAYFKKLNEIRSDEARIIRLKEEIAGLNR